MRSRGRAREEEREGKKAVGRGKKRKQGKIKRPPRRSQTQNTTLSHQGLDSSTNEPGGSLRHFSQCGCSHWAQISSTRAAAWRGWGATKAMAVVKFGSGGRKKREAARLFVSNDCFRFSRSPTELSRISNASSTERARREKGRGAEGVAKETEPGRARGGRLTMLFSLFRRRRRASRVVSSFRAHSRSVFFSFYHATNHHASRRPLLRPRPRLRGRGLRSGLVPAQARRHGEAPSPERGSSGGCIKVAPTVGRASDAGESAPDFRGRRPAGAVDPRPVRRAREDHGVFRRELQRWKRNWRRGR